MKKYHELVVKIRDAIRKKAQDVPKFKESGNGAIRILAYPLNKEADFWLGGLGYFDSGFKDIPDYEVTFAITPGGSRVIEGVWDGEKQKVDCYAYSALKIAHCSRAQDLGKGLVSGLDLGESYLEEDNGYSAHPGAICVEINHLSASGNREDFCGIYVCVSGADSADDEICAFEAINVIKDFFENEDEKFTCRFPKLSEKNQISVQEDKQ